MNTDENKNESKKHRFRYVIHGETFYSPPMNQAEMEKNYKTIDSMGNDYTACARFPVQNGVHGNSLLMIPKDAFPHFYAIIEEI